MVDAGPQATWETGPKEAGGMNDKEFSPPITISVSAQCSVRFRLGYQLVYTKSDPGKFRSGWMGWDGELQQPSCVPIYSNHSSGMGGG